MNYKLKHWVCQWWICFWLDKRWSGGLMTLYKEWGCYQALAREESSQLQEK
jgi:hypothetical protein